MKKRFLGGVALLLTLVLALAGCGPKISDSKQSGSESKPEQQAANKEPINIGIAIDMSGGTASYGLAAQQAADIAVEEFNKAGGYQGRPVKVILYDDTANPQKSLELVTRLISQDKVVALIGPANSGNANQHIETVQKAEIPEVIPVATAAPITLKYQNEPKNYIFRVSMVDSAQVTTMLRFAKEKGYKKVALIHDTTGYGTFGKDELTKQAAAEGIEIVETVAFQVGDTSVEPQLNKIRDAKPEMVVIYALAPEVSTVLKSADKINYSPVFMGTWASGDPLLKKLAGDLVNKGNLYMIQSFTIDQSPAAAEFDKKMSARYGDKYIFPIAAAQTYDSLNIILKALSKAGPDPKAMRDAIESMSDFKGVTAAPAQPFTKENHEAINAKDMFVGTWKDGKVIKAK